MILDNEVLEFYKWDGDVKEKLEETQVSFKVSSSLHDHYVHSKSMIITSMLFHPWDIMASAPGIYLDAQFA